MQKTYRLAKVSPYAVTAFGPMMTLQQAQRYQTDMIAGGFNVAVKNMAEGIDWHMRPQRKVKIFPALPLETIKKAPMSILQRAMTVPKELTL